MSSRRRTTIIVLSLLMLVLFSSSSYAIPAFSRQYGTSCSTCHIDFPKLNDFGKAFKDAGFKFPKDDETFIKVPPILLGAPAQKDLWPHTIWPGSIPGLPPIGLRYNHFFQVLSRNRNAFNNQLLGTGTAGPFIPRTDFQTGLFSIFTAGNFGSDIAFWVDDDFSVAGANSNGGLGDAYLKFVNLGRLLKLPTDALSVRFGQFELDIPFSQARTWNLSGWDIYDQTNFGTPGDNVNNGFAFSSPAQGIEFSGGHNYGGYHYSLAIVNQNTSGTSASPANVSPQTSFASDSNFKDLYGRFSYRFNLERDPASRHEIQAAGATGPRDHTYLNLGTLYFYGRSVQRATGVESDGVTKTVITAREPFYRAGADFSFNYRTFNVFGQYLYGRDRNLIPFIPGTFTLPVGFIGIHPVKYSGGFLEADYLVLPWMMTILRWDNVNSHWDYLNGIGADASAPPPAPFLSPFHANRNRITPGIQFLIHANIKTSFEYQIRPQQIVYAPGTTTAITSPFRTNSAVAGLEFVY